MADQAQPAPAIYVLPVRISIADEEVVTSPIFRESAMVAIATRYVNQVGGESARQFAAPLMSRVIALLRDGNRLAITRRCVSRRRSNSNISQASAITRCKSIRFTRCHNVLTHESKLKIEAAATLFAFAAMTDSGDHLTFTTTNKPWSRADSEPVFGGYGVITGGAVTPAVSGTDDMVDSAAVELFAPGMTGAIRPLAKSRSRLTLT